MGIQLSTEAPGPTTPPLGRLPALMPHVHARLAFLDADPGVVQPRMLPKAAHCNTFAGCVPKDAEYDPVFYAGVIYQIYFDSVVTAGRPSKAQTVERIVGFSKIARDSANIQAIEKASYLSDYLGVSKAVSAKLIWTQMNVMAVSSLTSIAAVKILTPMMANILPLW